jgi:hypothetical protein
MYAELREHVFDVMPHRVRTHVELGGNLAVSGATREQARDLRFALRQPEAREARSRLLTRATVAKRFRGSSRCTGGTVASRPVR